MEYPVLAYKENEKFIYAFSKEKDLKETSRELLRRNVFKDTNLLDATGRKYKILSASEVGWAGNFLGFSPLKKGRQIRVAFDLSEIGMLSLPEVKSFVIDRLENNAHYHLDEIKNDIENAQSYGEIYSLFY